MRICNFTTTSICKMIYQCHHYHCVPDHPHPPCCVSQCLIIFFFQNTMTDKPTTAAEADMATKVAEVEIPTKVEKPTEVVTPAGAEMESEGEDSSSISWISTFSSSSSSEYCPSPPHANLKRR